MRDTTKLDDIIKDFITKNYKFCSEKDFQFSLAWEIKQKLQEDSEVILEYPYKKEDAKIIYIDICVIQNNKKHFIELKYKTKKENISRHNVDMELTNQFAQDIGRYSFCKDIKRLEEINENTSYAIFLTNDKAYWEKRGTNKNTLDDNFRIHENQLLSNTLIWQNKEQKEQHWTNKYPQLSLQGKYLCQWCECKTQKTDELLSKFLCLKIEKNSKPSENIKE